MMMMIMMMTVLLFLTDLHFRQGESLARVFMQHPRDEIFELLTYWGPVWEHYWIILDLAV